MAEQLARYAAARSGDVSVAVYDAVTGQTADYADRVSTGYATASAVKMSILVARLAQGGSSGRLSTRDRELAEEMIRVSDNDAATALWTEIGGARAMNALFRSWGMTHTSAGAGGYWGATTTSAADQLVVLKLIAYPNRVLSDAARATAIHILDGVVGSQRWGVTSGVPAGAAVEVKNGWLPRRTGWVVTSLGHVHGSRDYLVAILTRDNATERDGIDTISGLSRVAWSAAAVR